MEFSIAIKKQQTSIMAAWKLWGQPDKWHLWDQSFRIRKKSLSDYLGTTLTVLHEHGKPMIMRIIDYKPFIMIQCYIEIEKNSHFILQRELIIEEDYYIFRQTIIRGRSAGSNDKTEEFLEKFHLNFMLSIDLLIKALEERKNGLF